MRLPSIAGWGKTRAFQGRLLETDHQWAISVTISGPARHDKMIELVERMLKLHKDLPKARTALDETQAERMKAEG